MMRMDVEAFITKPFGSEIPPRRVSAQAEGA